MRDRSSTHQRRHPLPLQQEQVSRYQFLERIANLGWVPALPQPDLGEDFVVHVYLDGRATGISFYVQLKSVARFNSLRRAGSITYRIKVKDLLHWEGFSLPVALVVWDITNREGRWSLIDDLIKNLDQIRQSWRTSKTVSVNIPWGNSTDDQGLRSLQHNIAARLLPLILKGRPFDIHVKASFPQTDEAQHIRHALEESFKEGTAVTIPGTYLQEVAFSEPLQEWMSGIDPSKINIDIVTSPSPTERPAAIEVIGNNGKSSAIDNLALRLERGGTEVVVLSNRQQPSPVLVTVTLTRREKAATVNITLSARGNGRHAGETRKIIDFFEAAASGGTVALTFPTANVPPLVTTTPPGSASPVDPSFSRLVDMICSIQDATGRFLRVPDAGISERDAHDIQELLAIIQSGKLVRPSASLNISLGKEAIPLVIDVLRKNLPIHLRFTSPESEYSILGEIVQTGAITRSIKGKPSISLPALEEAFATLPDNQSIPLSFPSVVLTDVYPLWFRREATTVTNAIASRFPAVRAFLYGPILWDEVLPPDAAIQIALSGIASQDVEETRKTARSTSRAAVELSLLAEMPSALRNRIEAEGLLLFPRTGGATGAG